MKNFRLSWCVVSLGLCGSLGCTTLVPFESANRSRPASAAAMSGSASAAAPLPKSAEIEPIAKLPVARPTDELSPQPQPVPAPIDLPAVAPPASPSGPSA